MLLSSLRGWRGIVWTLITWLENRVDTYKIKDELTRADQLVIQHLIKKFKMLDTEFRQYHFAIMELQENEAIVEEERATLDDYS